jgi:hypothetical protein
MGSSDSGPPAQLPYRQHAVPILSDQPPTELHLQYLPRAFVARTPPHSRFDHLVNLSQQPHLGSPGRAAPISPNGVGKSDVAALSARLQTPSSRYTDL